MHRESQDWVRTIESERGYRAIDARRFRRLLVQMPRYGVYRAILRHVRPGQSVLEAGCGWALASFALAERGISATALDIAEKLVADLQTLRGELGPPYSEHCTPTTGDILRLPALRRTFDAVVSDGTYEHFPEAADRRAILEGVRAVLRPGGTFVVAVPNLRNPFFGSVVDRVMPTMHVFTIESLAAELAAGGFHVVETGYAFVNPGFEQWVKSRWMIPVIRTCNAFFPLLPRSVQNVLAAHLYCVARLEDPTSGRS